MLKKVAIYLSSIFWVLLLFMIPLAQAETYIYGGSQIIVPGGGETEGYGGGMMFGLGQKIGKNLILWADYEGIKTKEANEQDNVYAGLSILSGPIINWSILKGGIFLLIEGGIQNAPDTPVEFGNLVNAGFYFRVSETSDLYIGGGYSGDVYSIDIGTAIRLWE